jgi:hypothetical protein
MVSIRIEPATLLPRPQGVEMDATLIELSTIVQMLGSVLSYSRDPMLTRAHRRLRKVVTDMEDQADEVIELGPSVETTWRVNDLPDPAA